jgi:hypothetical protein
VLQAEAPRQSKTAATAVRIVRSGMSFIPLITSARVRRAWNEQLNSHFYSI